MVKDRMEWCAWFSFACCLVIIGRGLWVSKSFLVVGGVLMGAGTLGLIAIGRSIEFQPPEDQG